jgi:hypothetical protein
MTFNCVCCNVEFKTSSNLQKHKLTASHLRIQAKLDSEPTENLIFRNKILTLETENTILKKRLAELEKEVKHKQQTINTIVQIVNKVAKVDVEESEKPEVHVEEVHVEEVHVEEEIHVEEKEVHVEEEVKESEPKEPEPKELEPEEPEKNIKHHFVDRPYPKTKNKQVTYCLETFINLKIEDVYFCVENNFSENEILEVDMIRSFLDDIRRKHTWTKDKILGIYEEVFKNKSKSPPKIQTWKNHMEESSLSRIKTFLRLSDNPCG